MEAADEELLRLLRAVKAHEPTERGRFDEDADEDDALALDYADAFDEDAVLLCLNALQAAVDAGEWRASPSLARLVDELLDWRIGALDLDRKPKTELLVVRWRFVTRAIEADAVDNTGDALAARLLETMAGDRFAALDVQYAVAQCLCSAIDRGVVGGASEQALALLKQFYVTLARASARQQLGAAMCALLRSKDDVKRALGDVGLLRAVVQVALTEQRALDAKRALGQDLEDDEDDKLAKLIETAVRSLHHVARLTCPQSNVLELVSSDFSTPRVLCGAVVELALSRVTTVFEESVRLLQMLVECPPYLAALPSVPDLRGALEKAKTLATTPEGKPTVQDAYVRSLCEQLGALLTPQIDAHEQRHGSLVGLSGALDHEASLSPETALEAALECKTRGNAFYQRGNFATARLLYRRAIAIVRSAEFQAERRLGALPVDELRRQCSVGASVQVLQRDGALRSAMVSDVEDDEDVVEVLYDDGAEEEERVPLRRLRLRMATQLLEQFKTVAVDCWMNMGKAFSMLFDQERAVECFSSVLALQPQYIAALYHRGVASLVVHDLQRAQKDLWEANQLCSKWKTLGDASETKKKKALHAQIVAAYKKLQTLHASKKKVDKRLIKQMMGYISSLPGLQDGTMDDGSNI